MTHKEQSAAFAAEAVAARGDIDWETFARFLAKQMGWARDKIFRGEQLCMDEWDKAHLRTVAQALAPDHPMMKRFQAEMDATGKKQDAGKPPIDLVPTEPIRQIAAVLGHGADKYGAHNWRGGLAASRLYAAVQRHLMAWLEGEDLDPTAQGGSGLPHLAHAACELFFLIQTLKDRPDLDDRYRPLQTAGRGMTSKELDDIAFAAYNATLGDQTKAHLGDAR